MLARELLAGFDVGTSAVKGAIFNLNGEPVASFRRDYPKTFPRPGWVEQNPADWVLLIKEGLLAFSKELDMSRVAAMCICSQTNTHVLVDKHGSPVAPAVVWQDTRASELARELDRSFSDEEMHAIWGGDFVVDASFALSRAKRFAQFEPALWERTRWILSPKDYCKMELIGVASSDPFSSVGLADHKGYVTGLEERLDGFEYRLPPLHDMFAPQGILEMPDLPGFAPTLINGTMDAWGNLFGSGVTAHGDGMLVAGTSSIVGVLSENAYPVRGVITFAPFSGKRLHAGPTQAGADALTWFAQLSGETPQTMLKKIRGRKSHSAPLLFLAHLQGERAPLWDATASGVFVGLKSEHDVVDMGRAVLEGVAFSEKHLLEEIQKAAGYQPAVLRLSGGSARSDSWSQIRADILQTRLDRVAITDSGVLGAAMIGALGVGLFPDIQTAAEQLVEIETSFRPNELSAGYVNDMYRNYRATYTALTNVFGAMHQIQP